MNAFPRHQVQVMNASPRHLAFWAKQHVMDDVSHYPGKVMDAFRIIH
jgi:hypothetical protein